MEGRIIAGRYRLVRVLGRGGMGAVWQAEHVSLGTPVAVKLINSELANHPEARVRFAREAQLAARIRSAHVTQIHDHGVTEEGEPYIAMECLVGESLSERLAARRRLPLAETARIISHVCRGIARAHEAGLIHRDLKPENIFLAREGSDEIAKVLDFGVAKATDALASDQARTRTGALLGTPHYMSPEQAQGLKTIDWRSDLWSLGVVTFECITGTRPFVAPALGPLIALVIAAPIPVPSRTAPDAGIPPEVDEWMARALARAPEERFSSADEFSRALMAATGAIDSSIPVGAERGAPRSHASARSPALSEPPRAEVASPLELDGTVAVTASAHLRIAERAASPRSAREASPDVAKTVLSREASVEEAKTVLDSPPGAPPTKSARWIVLGIAATVAVIGWIALALHH